MNDYIKSLEQQNINLSYKCENLAAALQNANYLRKDTSARLFALQLHDENDDINLCISATICELFETLKQIHDKVINALWQQNAKTEFELYICYGRNTVLDYIGYKLVMEGRNGMYSLHKYNIKTKHSWNTFEEFLIALDNYLCQSKSMSDKYYEYRYQWIKS